MLNVDMAEELSNRRNSFLFDFFIRVNSTESGQEDEAAAAALILLSRGGCALICRASYPVLPFGPVRIFLIHRGPVLHSSSGVVR